MMKSAFICIILLLCCSATLGDDDRRENYDAISWLKKLADNGQEASLRAKKKQYNFKKIFSDDVFDLDKLRKSSFELMDAGVPSKAGYGFLMGYTSGFFLKKISRVLAFMTGAIFIIFQGLSYQGYVSLNHDKLKKDIEGMLDVNMDGNLDSKDAVEAYSQLNTFLSYNMPTGGGFTGGLLMSIRA